MIAMALVNDPKVLIADEPTTALDVTIQAQILPLIERLQEQLGMAVILITHDLGVVLPEQPRDARADGGFSSQGETRIGVRSAFLRRVLRRRSVSGPFRRLDRGASSRGNHRRKFSAETITVP